MNRHLAARVVLFSFVMFLIAAAVLCLSGCSAVGPTVAQTIEGQKSANSILNKASFIDNPQAPGTGSSIFEATGPIEIITQTPERTEAKSSGLVPRTLTIERPDGVRVTLRSGSDANGSIVADPVTGNVTRFDFTTSSSAPLDALGRVTAIWQGSIQSLSADQVEAIRIEAEAFVKGVEATSATAGAIIRAALGL